MLVVNLSVSRLTLQGMGHPLSVPVCGVSHLAKDPLVVWHVESGM